MSQLAQCLGFDLANALAGHVKRSANLFQRVLRAVLQTEAHLDNLLFPRIESAEHVIGSFLEVHVDDCFGGRDSGAVLVKSCLRPC